MRVRFDAFELDVTTGELSKNGRRLKLQDQPAKLLALLVRRRGELVTRTEIQAALWGEDRFVEFEHAINTAIKKIRETLEDDTEHPRFVETLPRKGYRFIAEVGDAGAVEVEQTGREFVLPLRVENARRLFLLAQVPYVATYLAVFSRWDVLDLSLQRAFDIIPVRFTLIPIQLLALLGFAVRVYLVVSVGWQHPEAGRKYRKLFPCLLVLDSFWAATPLLAQPTVGWTLALTGLVLMAWLVWGQRTLMLSIYPRS